MTASGVILRSRRSYARFSGSENGVQAAVRGARAAVARALLVQAPRGRVVAVRVDAVLGVAEHAVAVVVAHRLAPEALGRLAQCDVGLGGVRRADDPVGVLVDVGAAQRVGRVGDQRGAAHLVVRGAEARAAGERVVVAVRVLDREEPELVAAQQLGDLGIVGVLEPPRRHAPADLGRDPLAGVVDGGEQHRRARAVGDVARVLGDLEGDDVLALAGLADHDQLGQAAVFGGQRGHLVLDAAGLGVGAEHVVERVRRVAAGLGLGGRLPLARLARGDLVGDLGLGHVRAGDDLLEREALGARLARLRVDQVDEDRLRPVDASGRSRCDRDRRRGRRARRPSRRPPWSGTSSARRAAEAAGAPSASETSSTGTAMRPRRRISYPLVGSVAPSPGGELGGVERVTYAAAKLPIFGLLR